MLVFLGTVILFILSSIYLFFKYSYSYWSRQDIPCIKPESIYGSMKYTIQQTMTVGEEMELWYKEYKSKGLKFICGYYFHKPVCLAIDPELVKDVMAKKFDNFSDRGVYCNEKSDPLSTHLFSLEGEKWKTLRRKLTPTFTSGKIKNMFQILVDCSEDLKNCLDEPVALSEPINIKKHLIQYTTDVIGSAAFGLDCNSFRNPDSEFIRIGHIIFNPDFIYKIKTCIAFMFPNIAKFIKICITNTKVDHFFRNLVRETIEYRENNNISRNDFIQLLMKLKRKPDEHEYTVDKGLTMDEVAAQAFIFFIAGFETSSTTLTFSLYELAKHADIQEKARNEIINVLKKYDGAITYDAVLEMHYLEKTVLEAMRKHPPVMALQRRVTKDYMIPDTKIVLKKDVLIFIPVLALHQDPEFYPEPEKYDPERFSEENKTTRPDFTYLPFGEGPRICIGLRFGMMQTKVGLCRLLLNYQFSLNPKTNEPLHLDPNSLVRTVKDGIWLTANKIN